MSETEKHCLIIGAGPAGLTAAYELLKHPEAHIHPIIFEASDAIGGISKPSNIKATASISAATASSPRARKSPLFGMKSCPSKALPRKTIFY
jgi:ribulose 1,5-bisphosphate synthetase/thiazole synthase